MLLPVSLVQLVISPPKEKPIVLDVLHNVLLVKTPKPTVPVVLNIEMTIHQLVLKIVLSFIVNAICKEICFKSVKMIQISTKVEFGKNQSDPFTSQKD